MGPFSRSGGTGEDSLSFPDSHYADSLFSRVDTVAPTDIGFFSFSNLRQRHANNIPEGDMTMVIFIEEINEIEMRRVSLQINSNKVYLTP